MARIIGLTTLQPCSWGVHLSKAALLDMPEEGRRISIPPSHAPRVVIDLLSPPGTHVELVVGCKPAAYRDGVMPARLLLPVMVRGAEEAHLHVTLDRKNRAVLDGGPVGVVGYYKVEVE